MKKTLIKSIACYLSIISITAVIPQKVNATTLTSSVSSFNNDSAKDKHTGSWIFDKDNLNYLSKKQKKQLEEIKKLKDNCKELSEEQKQQLIDIKETVLKKKLGDEKYKDFKALIEKKHCKKELTEDEKAKLKEYKDIIRSSKKDSNRATFKDFLR
ncbi:hypothetical protein [Clostridium taeniosporum]|uniref:Uncharacterized protein n=1 Tax=Clostridium taeniosporum TaxID=394958 RepID=A0A1D7XLZ8_9CLOT|nr:hypothetical protein [Clostridium taeniosporum]AOR24361.1 hypothetical protein BGI42_11725 [Clostridium taeniosporum]